MKEKEFQEFLWQNPHLIEDGLTQPGREVQTGAGPADLIFKDKEGKTLLVELKIAGTSKAEPQINRYAAAYCIQNNLDKEKIRRMVVTFNASETLAMACKISNIELKEIGQVQLETLTPIIREKIIYRMNDTEPKAVIYKAQDLQWYEFRFKLEQRLKTGQIDRINKELDELGFDEPLFLYSDWDDGTELELKTGQTNARLDLLGLPVFLKLIESSANQHSRELFSGKRAKVVKIHSTFTMPDPGKNYFDLTISGENCIGRVTTTVVQAFNHWKNHDFLSGNWYTHEKGELRLEKAIFPEHRPVPAEWVRQRNQQGIQTINPTLPAQPMSHKA